MPLHRRIVLALACAAACATVTVGTQSPAPRILQFVFTSDAHYGLTRAAFRGATNVPAHVVNHAMVEAINRLTGASFAKDGGVRSAMPIGDVDFVVQAGDIANREEVTDTGAIQPAAVSWAQFQSDYVDGLALIAPGGRRAPLFIVPGNHDVSNAIGYHRPMTPATDASSMAAIFNLMMAPATPLTSATYRYDRDRILTSRDIGGFHFEFVTVWPDSTTRAWMAKDLARVSASTPVVVFAHDQPDCEAKHFRNPNGRHDINDADQFENLLADTLADGTTTAAAPVAEQRALERFLDAHPNVTAYFHGNSNWNQFYDWTGPDHTALLHTFRVDSPMKGAASAGDETRLSFQVATIDLDARVVTVRECLWNLHPDAASHALAWGASTTVALQPRPKAR